MILNSGVVQIMWKDIFIIFAVVYAMRLIIEAYMLFAYKNIFKDFYSVKSKGLERRAEKLRKLFNLFSDGPFKRSECLMYNHLCLLLSSMALLEGDEAEFLKQLNVVKHENDYELKPFVLALYYRSKNNIEIATKYYQKYLECNHEDDNIKIILDGLFANQECSISDVSFLAAAGSFRNPAIIKLIADNGISINDGA